jgi:hypothetical protein
MGGRGIRFKQRHAQCGFGLHSSSKNLKCLRSVEEGVCARPNGSFGRTEQLLINSPRIASIQARQFRPGGLEGIVSKRKDSRYKSGRSPDWVKSKNPDAPAVKREAEEEWGRWSAAKPRRSSR